MVGTCNKHMGLVLILKNAAETTILLSEILAIGHILHINTTMPNDFFFFCKRTVLYGFAIAHETEDTGGGRGFILKHQQCNYARFFTGIIYYLS